MNIGVASLLRAQTVLFSYSAQSGAYANAVTQSGSFQAMQPGVDSTALGPDGLPLFAIDFTSNTLTITGLRNFTDSSYLEFHWGFSLASTSGTAFRSATLLSNSLFSIPPFTFAVDPTVSYTASTKMISVDRFIASGSGTATVNNGGVAVVSFTPAIPEPSVSFLLAFVGFPIFLFALVRRNCRTNQQGTV